MNVRESCAMIIIKNGVIIDELRVDDTQNVSWVMMIKAMFIIINILMDGLIELNL